MTISQKLKAMCGRLIRAVPPDCPGAVDSTPADSRRFIAASALPDDPDTLIEAGIISPWRVDASGERWFRAVDAASLDRWSCPVIRDDSDDGEYDPDADFYHSGFDDSGDDPFAELPGADDDDDDGFDSRNPYRWSGNE